MLVLWRRGARVQAVQVRGRGPWSAMPHEHREHTEHDRGEADQDGDGTPRRSSRSRCGTSRGRRGRHRTRRTRARTGRRRGGAPRRGERATARPGAEQVKAGFVEEERHEARVGRIERAGVLGHALRAVDRDAPGKVRRRPVELLVEEVAPSGDGLAQEHRRHRDVRPAQEREVVAPRVDDDADMPPAIPP